MDQEPSLRPEYLSVPSIVAPENNDAFDAQTVTISGTADPEVKVRMWDWLSPVATTTANGNGYWSITLHDVEVGDHMYCAEAFRESEGHSARSKIVAIRVASSVRAPSEQARRTSLRWKLPPTEVARKLSRRRRSDRGDHVGEQTRLKGGWEPTFTVQSPAPAQQTTDTPQPGEPSVPSAQDTPLQELSESVPVATPDFVPKRETVVDDLPIEIGAIAVPDEPAVIGASTRALAQPLAPIDLGAVDEVLDPVPLLDAATESVAVRAAARRVWTERTIVAATIDNPDQ